MYPRSAVLQPGIARLGQAVVQLLRQVIQGEHPADIRLEPVIFEGDPMRLVPGSQVVELLNRQSAPGDSTTQQPDNVTTNSQTVPSPAPEVEGGVPGGLIDSSFAGDVERHPDVPEPVPPIAETLSVGDTTTQQPDNVTTEFESAPPQIEPDPLPEATPELAPAPPVAPEIPAPIPVTVIPEEPARPVIATTSGEPEVIDPQISQINADRARATMVEK